MSCEKKLTTRYQSTRQKTIAICDKLALEDYVVQPCPEVSPPKWHLGHTTWFFEEVILNKFLKTYERYDPHYPLLFNSYYKAGGKHWLQQERGFVSRPRVSEVLRYREATDQLIIDLLQDKNDDPELRFLMELGLQHEQQHQELLIMDIKYILGTNPQLPTYCNLELPASKAHQSSWQSFSEGVYEIGNIEDNFAYDNECPRHKTYLYPFKISETTVSNGEYLEFMEAKGYEQSRLWLSLGWDWVQSHQVSHPLYWHKLDDKWYEFTLHGLKPLNLNYPVTHISYFEAQAYAHFKEQRLPTEQEMEIFLNKNNPRHNKTSELLQPTQLNSPINQVWCWSSSHYSPYPGFKPYNGMIEEYNGKFMCNQFVLKGGCVATADNHYRNSYRNFYLPQQQWMFSGIRLTEDLK